MVGGKPVNYFTSNAEDLNFGLRRTKCGQGGIELGAFGLPVQGPNSSAMLSPQK